MKIEAVKITKLIEQNFTHLMPDFYEMQTEYLASLNIIYHDLDASLVAMVLTNQLYKNVIQNNNSLDKISLNNFYQKNNYQLPVSALKIKEISSIINLPRETVRRKKEKLLKEKVILLDKKNRLYTLNTSLIDKKILKIQIDNLCKFLSNFSIFLSPNKFNIREVNRDEIRKDVDRKFLLYLTFFLEFQISYFSKLKTLMDIESIFITLLCTLNTTTHTKKELKLLNSKDIFFKKHSLNKSFGLNATSIAEITRIPRTTVLRKISNAEKMGILKKDKFKRYASESLSDGEHGIKKIYPVMEHTLKILGVFFSKCFETYSAKTMA